MNRHRLAVGLLIVLLAVSLSAEAWARAGRSSSLGSRGSRTSNRPIERTITPPSRSATPGLSQQQPLYSPNAIRPPSSPATPGLSQQQPLYSPNAIRPPSSPATPGLSQQQPLYNSNAMQPGANAPLAGVGAASGGFFQRNPIMGGMLGGLLGVGIGSMLFGHSPAIAAATDASPMAGMLGSFLQLALVGGLIWLGVRLFKRRQQTAGLPLEHSAPEQFQPQTALPAQAGTSTAIAKEFDVNADDQATFSRIIDGVQKAWSDGDPVALRRLVTPEVAGWIAEDLARDQANGLRNVVEDVTLIKGDISESWRENGLDYATAIITFSARDYMIRLSDGAVAEGDPRHAVEATEAWTFVRGSSGDWVLSAIEQM